MRDANSAGLTPVGKILSFLMIVALLGLGVWLMVRDGDQAAPPARQEAQAPSGSDVAQAPAAGRPPGRSAPVRGSNWKA